MSTIDVSGKKLVSYELLLKGFSSKENRSLRRAFEKSQNDSFRYIDYDNTFIKANPSMTRVFVRYAGKTSKLADEIMGIIEDRGFSSEEPIVSPGLTDLVFEKSPDEE